MVKTTFIVLIIVTKHNYMNYLNNLTINSIQQ